MTARTPLDTVERALRRLRWAATACSLLWLLLHSPSLDGSWFDDVAGWFVALVPTVALLVSGLLGRTIPSTDRLNRVVATQVALDVAATAAVIVLARPAVDSGLWLIPVFPVLEGALRFGSNGAVLATVGLAVPLLVQRIIGWAPGDGYAPMRDVGGRLGVALVLGAVAGAVTTRLVDEVDDAAEERARSQRRARRLAVLTVASDRLASRAAGELAEIAVDAAVELGFEAAWLTVVHSAQADPQIVAGYGEPTFDDDQLARFVADADIASISETAEGRSLACLARRGDRTMVLVADAPMVDDQAGQDQAGRDQAGHDEDRADRDEALRVLVAHLVTALRTLGRERDAAAVLHRLEAARSAGLRG